MEIVTMDEVEKRLERRLEAQSADLKEHISIHLEPIRIQTTKTNGRVSIMEKMVYMAAGAVVILTPFVYYIASEVAEIKDSLSETVRIEARNAVDEAFDDRIQALEIAE